MIISNYLYPLLSTICIFQVVEGSFPEDWVLLSVTILNRLESQLSKGKSKGVLKYIVISKLGVLLECRYRLRETFIFKSS